jgi:hypothetical protein
MPNYFLFPEEAVELINSCRGNMDFNQKAKAAYPHYFGSLGNRHFYEDAKGVFRFANPSDLDGMKKRWKMLITAHEEGRKLFFASQRKPVINRLLGLA